MPVRLGGEVRAVLRLLLAETFMRLFKRVMIRVDPRVCPFRYPLVPVLENAR
jgi:hypothetical protein